MQRHSSVPAASRDWRNGGVSSDLLCVLSRVQSQEQAPLDLSIITLSKKQSEGNVMKSSGRQIVFKETLNLHHLQVRI